MFVGRIDGKLQKTFDDIVSVNLFLIVEKGKSVMKTFYGRKLFVLNACILISVLLAGSVFAQARKVTGGATAAAAGSAAKDAISVKAIEVTSNNRTPDYSYSGSSSEANITPGNWAKVLVKFDTDAEWTDQLEMKFYIVVKNQKNSAYTMFTGSYVYSDIPKGRGHQVAVYLRPRTLERYGNVVERAAVEVYSGGQVVALRSYPESNQPWWRTANVRSIDGQILDRSLTPFAFIAVDNYEIPVKGR